VLSLGTKCGECSSVCCGFCVSGVGAAGTHLVRGSMDA
jgi:hypothetical protein